MSLYNNYYQSKRYIESSIYKNLSGYEIDILKSAEFYLFGDDVGSLSYIINLCDLDLSIDYIRNCILKEYKSCNKGWYSFTDNWAMTILLDVINQAIKDYYKYSKKARIPIKRRVECG